MPPFYLAIASALCLCAAVHRICAWLRWRRDVNARFPGPPALPLLGNVLDLVRAGGFNEAFFRDLHATHGPVARFWIFGALNVSVTDPALAQEVYRACPTRPKETEWFLGFLGRENLLFQTDPARVKALRLKYQALVTSREVRRRVVAEARAVFARRLRGGTLRLRREFGPYIYDIMGAVLFGRAWSETEHGSRIYALHTYLIREANRWAFYPVDPWWNADFRRYRRSITELREILRTLLRRSTKEGEGDSAVMDLLKRETDAAGRPFFHEALAVSTLLGLLNGAFDTTHATLVWTLHALAKRPAIQARLRAEIAAAGNPDRALGLPYLDRVIQESMRLVATVPVNQRVNLRADVRLSSGHVVPRGANVNLPMFLTFRQAAAAGPNPAAFDPDRFTTRRPLVTPFGQHTRMCVGFTFAKDELRAILVAVLRRFSLALPEDEPEPRVMIEAGVNQPAEDIRVVFEELPHR